MKIFLSLNEQEHTDESGPYQKKSCYHRKKIISIKLHETKLIKKKRKTLLGLSRKFIS
jgi:hypothetical protein